MSAVTFCVMAPDDPIGCAHLHGRELLDAVGLGVEDVGVDAIAQARPQWPVWPQVALSELVGPPGAHVVDLDLRWLHRFGVVVSLVDQLAANVGGPVGGPTALGLLVERAQMLGHRGWGAWSAGTSCRILPAIDGWVAINLPRESDLDSAAALVDAEPRDDAWALLEVSVPTMSRTALVERSELLGIPLAAVAESWELDAQRRHRGMTAGPLPLLVEAGPPRPPRTPRVLDLTSLWAGPLVGLYLARCGASVAKVESTQRPDGAREGTPGFYQRLNGAKQRLDMALHRPEGVHQLRALVDQADIVIEASRPRAMEAFGIDPASVVDRGGIWCSITGYGRTGPWSNRVAFGDDAAAAGGLVTNVDNAPWFIGDAAADPISGVTAALGVLALWARGVGGRVDVAMRDAVSHLTGGGPVACRLAASMRSA